MKRARVMARSNWDTDGTPLACCCSVAACAGGPRRAPTLQAVTLRRERALERCADAVGVVTLVIGVACTVVPTRAGPALGLGGGSAETRVVGAVDLVLAAGLLRRGGPDVRWRWMAARAASNGVLAGLYAHHGQREGLRRMVALGVFDGALAVALSRRTSGRAG